QNAVRHPVCGIQGAEWVLEHHRRVAAVGKLRLASARRGQRFALVADLAGGGPVDARQQPRDGRLSAAALADQRDDLARIDHQVHVVDRVQVAPRKTCANLEMPAEADCLDERLWPGLRLRLGHEFTSSERDSCGSLSGVSSRQRALTWPSSPIWYSSGSWLRQRSCTTGQRGLNRQPLGGLPRSGGLPGIPLSSTRSPWMDGNASSRPLLYGCDGVSKTVRVGPVSTTWPAYITTSRSENRLTSDMSWVTKMTAKPSSCCSSLICTISERCATTSSAEVGSSMMTRSGVNSSAIAIIARCRMPPESWCG